MNPVLLKPQSDVGSQVVVHGKVIGSAKGRDYQKLKPKLLDAVMTSFERLCTDADIVVVEGAGSPAEINLRKGDIANMGFATRANVPVILVGDIDRGGVIASLVGTHTILPDEDRAMIVGFLINKFRGDVSLFDDGLTSVTEFTGWPSFGVVPWLKEAMQLPAEDSVALENLMRRGNATFKIAVPMLDRISNFDDFDPLLAEDGVQFIIVKSNEALPTDAHLVIIPGSKSTISDLERFRENGWAEQLQSHVGRGGHVLGICGGYQMLGHIIADPDGIEGEPSEVEGLGLLQVETTMRADKKVRNVSARSCKFDVALSGYEIHIGETEGDDCKRPTAMIGSRPDGATSYDGKISGTYLHGYFNNGTFRKAWLASFGVGSDGGDHLGAVSHALDAIAERLEQLLDIDAMLAAAKYFHAGRPIR